MPPPLLPPPPGEVLLAVGTALGVLDAQGEDGKVGNLHVLALQEQLLDAAYHVGEHTLDGTLGEWRVVTGHVGSQLVQVDGLLDVGVGKPRVLVLFQYVQNHNDKDVRSKM